MPLSNELTLLKNAPLEFARNYWLLPGANYSNRPLDPNAPGYAFIIKNQVFNGQYNQTDSLLNMATDQDKVAFANLSKAAGGNKYNVDLYSRLQNNVPVANLLPVYYLPWWGDHVVKLTIPQRGQGPQGLPDPDLFFTTALTGCTVFVEGPAASPTIYHAGFDSNRDFTQQPRVNDPNTGQEAGSIEHWRILFNQYGGAANSGEAHKGQYLATPQRSTPDVQAYRQFLQSQHQNEMRIQDMTSEGTVFGVRDQGTGDWSFYLQESVTVTIYTLRKQRKVFGKSQMVDGEQRTYVRPMCVKQIFPTGANAITWNTTRLLP